VVASTSEASQSVDAGSVRAQAWNDLAIVDIFTNGVETRSVRAQLHKVGGSWMWTFFALLSPAFSSVTTTFSLSEH